MVCSAARSLRVQRRACHARRRNRPRSRHAHRHARRAGAARRFHPLALCQSGRAEGRPPRPGRARAPSTASIRSSSRGSRRQSIRGYVVESLMARGYDEPFTLYGLLARAVETDAARSYVTFHLDPAARFSDGKPVTAEDVMFSWQLLRDKGRPNHRTYYAKVAKAEAIGEQRGALRSLRQRRPRAAADPRTDAGVGEARGQSRRPSRRPRSRRRSAAVPMSSARSIPARASRSSAIRTTGAATFRSTAASGTSTRSASTITARPIRISRRSSAASTTCAPSTIRGAGRPATIFRPCATAA